MSAEIERLRRPGGAEAPVNRYPGPLLYEVEAWVDPFRWVDTLPWLAVPRFGPVRSGEQRDANLGWGMWPQTARLPHTPVPCAPRDGELELWVPEYEGDPERLTWRRRKWWGRGPIIFAPWGRPRLVYGLLRDRPALLWPGSPTRRCCR